jgi:acetolactate synthase-1/2/3 large subunit
MPLQGESRCKSAACTKQKLSEEARSGINRKILRGCSPAGDGPLEHGYGWDVPAESQPSLTGGDSVVAALQALGVEVVFGIPSVHNLPTYDALARGGTIRAITVRHEQAAAAAADGYARASGRLGVFITSTGPGAANAMGGLLEAFLSGSPVLHLTGQIETRFLDRGKGFIHEVPDQPAMLGSASKKVLRATSPDSLFSTVLTGGATALAHPRGPVSVELPIDLQYAETLPSKAPAPEAAEESPIVGIEEAAELIKSSRRAIIWAGGGAVASGAEEELRRLVDSLGAGLLTTPNARGVISEDDELCIGNLPWDRGVRELVASADLLIAVGTRYQGPNTENWKMELPPKIVQVDIDPAVPARNYQPTVGLRGDARQVLSALLEAIGDGSSQDPAWREEVAGVAAGARHRLRQSLGAQEALLDETAAAVTTDTVVVKDSTIPAYTWGNRLLPVRATRRAIMPNGFAIGLGLPHALGAAAATRRPVLCMVGDGGFMLSATELATIAAEQLPVVTAVYNDGGYGILRNIQDRQYGRRLGVDLGRPDFVELARALGIDADRVDTSEGYGKALRAALEAGRPYLLEVDLSSIGPMARPYTGTSRPPGEAAESS